MGCLVRDDHFNATSLVHTNAHAKFMWIHISPSQRQRDIYIAICYFLPASSAYAIHSVEDGDPFLDLYKCISKFATMGDIIVLGDFNAQTRDLQTPMHDRHSDWT